jgi:hypothetical protein
MIRSRSEQEKGAAPLLTEITASPDLVIAAKGEKCGAGSDLDH